MGVYELDGTDSSSNDCGDRVSSDLLPVKETVREMGVVDRFLWGLCLGCRRSLFPAMVLLCSKPYLPLALL